MIPAVVLLVADPPLALKRSVGIGNVSHDVLAQLVCGVKERLRRTTSPKATVRHFPLVEWLCHV
jgi:hypothetical protein